MTVFCDKMDDRVDEVFDRISGDVTERQRRAWRELRDELIQKNMAMPYDITVDQGFLVVTWSVFSEFKESVEFGFEIDKDGVRKNYWSYGTEVGAEWPLKAEV
jgi:hypothetical protein